MRYSSQIEKLSSVSELTYMVSIGLGRLEKILRQNFPGGGATLNCTIKIFVII